MFDSESNAYKSMINKINDLSHDNYKLKVELENKVKMIDALSGNNHEQDYGMDLYKDEIDKLVSHIIKLEKQIKDLNNEVAELGNDTVCLEEEIANLNDIIGNLEYEIAELQEQE